MSSLMIVDITDWGSFSEIRSFPEERQRALCERFPKYFKMKDVKETSTGVTLKSEIKRTGYGDLILDSTEAQEITDAGVTLTVKSFKGTIPYKVDGVPPGSFDSLHIHLPNPVLASFVRVTCLTDCCTDDLQSSLDAGWRVICVCPPLNQRRPDYILGHPERG